ncbi:hypothetical protein CsSME_00001694 [Camellia sinensis var. sinensis]
MAGRIFFNNKGEWKSLADLDIEMNQQAPSEFTRRSVMEPVEQSRKERRNKPPRSERRSPRKSLQISSKRVQLRKSPRGGAYDK